MVRTPALLLAAAEAVALVSAAPAEAGYFGLELRLVESDLSIDGASWDVWRAYVRVTDADDRVQAISGNAAHPLVITSVAGEFYQNEELGSNNIEPNPALFPIAPNLQWDTFVCLGRAELDQKAGPTQTYGVFPGDAPGFVDGELMADDGSWYRTPGNPGTEPDGSSGELRVIFGQFTVPAGTSVVGIVRVAGVFDGQQMQFVDQELSALDYSYCCLPSGRCDVVPDAGRCFEQGGILLPPDTSMCETCPEPCAGDGNRDGVVDVDDLVGVIAAWGEQGNRSGFDLDGSGVVDVDDLLVVINGWGQEYWSNCQ